MDVATETQRSLKDSYEVAGRTWDGFDAYLFDIDGTMLNCTDATHYFAFCTALTRVAGRELNLGGVNAHGNTDVGILRDALSLASVPESKWRPQIPAMLQEMSEYVEERKEELCTTVLPNVHALLQHLRAKGAKLGVATGNIDRIGSLKLESAGLLRYFDFMAWSNEYEHRSAVFQAAVARARMLTNEAATVCAVGDTPLDVCAARTNGIAVIAVATGTYSYEQLQAERPDLCLRSFADLPI